MPTAEPNEKATRAPEDKYFGVSIQEFLAATSAQVERGKYEDGTTIKPAVREALGQFTKRLQEPKLRISSYVFVFSRYFFIIIRF